MNRTLRRLIVCVAASLAWLLMVDAASAQAGYVLPQGTTPRPNSDRISASAASLEAAEVASCVRAASAEPFQLSDGSRNSGDPESRAILGFTFGGPVGISPVPTRGSRTRDSGGSAPGNSLLPINDVLIPRSEAGRKLASPVIQYSPTPFVSGIFHPPRQLA
jgi:hypothetical protein